MDKQERFPEGEAPLKNTDNAFVRVEDSRAQGGAERAPSEGEAAEGGEAERTPSGAEGQ